ncbi:MAG: phosphoglucosamine mutase [Chloroflexi bacterium]|nr:phosphoglucosamine mutase [Chloroflexota bacterium]
MRLFGSSGIRRIADGELVYLAVRVGLAVGQVHRNVVIGSDPRTSADALKHAVMSGLLAAGCRCDDAGVLPTPTLAFAARRYDAGVMITASHNPPEYNGIKLLNPDGSAFSPAQQQQVEDLVSDALKTAPWPEMKTSGVYRGAIEEHIESILREFPGDLGLKVVVDAGCGAASLVTPHLMRSLGCRVTALDCYPSGFFPRMIEPVEANLGNLMMATRELGADLGIAHDGDADRMMAVDGRGRFITGDKLLVILARSLQARDVVTTVDASMALDDMGFNIRRTRVGDSFVSEELKNGGDFGGETSGAWMFPRTSLCPDGIYAAAQVASAASRRPLAELADEVPSYPLVRGSVSSNGTALADIEARLLELKPLSVDRIDGVRLQFEDGWLLVRPSGTEPRIRLTAEARSEERAQQIYHDGRMAVTGA